MKLWTSAAVLLSLGLAVGCGAEDESSPPDSTPGGGEGGSGDDTVVETEGIPVLGNGLHTLDAVVFEYVSQPGDPLSTPRDLAFNPEVPNQLWVVNRGTESVTVYEDAGLPSQVATHYVSGGNDHFLAQPSALAFGQAGFMATIHETDERTQGPNGTPEDFMGPTLWTTDLDIFDGGHGGHMDMLHNSPNGAGIAWEADNTYWVFDGYHSALSRYYFNGDHGPGGADHSDGVLERFVENNVSWVENVPSHMEFHQESKLLYVADTGNNRVVALDTATGTRGKKVGPLADGHSEQYAMDGAVLSVVVDGASLGMAQPSGLAIHRDVLYVSDHATSTIYAFSLQGEMLDHLETTIPGGSLMGLEFDDAGNLWTVNAQTNQIIRISPKELEGEQL